MNFIDKKEADLETQLNDLWTQSKKEAIADIMEMIREDEVQLLNQVIDKDKFVPLTNAINGNQDIKAKVDYIENLYKRLKEQCS